MALSVAVKWKSHAHTDPELLMQDLRKRLTAELCGTVRHSRVSPAFKQSETDGKNYKLTNLLEQESCWFSPNYYMFN